MISLEDREAAQLDSGPLSCPHLALVPLDATEALAQGQVVSDRVPPASGGRPVVGEVVHYPFIDVLHWKPLVGRVFYCHEDQTAEGVRRLGHGRREGLVRCRGHGLRQWWYFEEGLQRQQVAPLVQPVETGQVILVGGAQALRVLPF